jgi:hypothetical protein
LKAHQLFRRRSFRTITQAALEILVVESLSLLAHLRL